MHPKNILILSDGRAGHFNLAEGIAAAIERRGPATTRRTDVRRGRWSGAVLAGLVRAHLPARPMLRLVYGLDEATLPESDVVVAAGAETLAASVWLARARGVPNIFYGSLRLFDPHDFGLVLTSYARNASRPRHALALKPSRLDPDSLPPSNTLNGPNPRLGLLIGGDAGGITYTPQEWSKLLDVLASTLTTTTWRWQIANSRRTPDRLSDSLAEIADRTPERITFLDVRRAGAGTLARLLAQCDAMLCTADSSSMVSECVWARRPTVALTPRHCIFTPDEAAYRNWLLDQGCCRTATIEDLTPEALITDLSKCTPLGTNPQIALGELIAQRLASAPNAKRPAEQGVAE